MTVRLLIDGAWRDGGAGWLDVEAPASGEVIGRVALASGSDLADAVAAAHRAFPGWATTPADQRGDVLKRAAALLRERAAGIAETLSVEGGKLPAEALGEVGRAAETLQWNGEEAGRIEGRALAGKAPASQRLSIPQPLGVVAAFAAWNFPAVLATRKLGAILAAGCTAILKPAEATPGTAADVIRALIDAGAPPGVVNLVFGEPAEVSRRLIEAPEVKAVTFTGSTAVGRIIAGQAAAGLKRTVLELGGHAPVVVDAGADVDLAVSATLPAKFGSAGQSCVAPTRYLVHESLHDTFVARFIAATRGVTVGPVIDARRVAALQALVADAVARGARIACGGTATPGPGHHFPPTVLLDVPGDADIMRDEPFGPVAVINRVAGIDEAITHANATDYAFAAYVFTDSLHTRQRVLADLRASNIGINQMAPSLPDAPLGGIEASGVGYEGGRDGIAAFQHLRLISETTTESK